MEFTQSHFRWRVSGRSPLVWVISLTGILLGLVCADPLISSLDPVTVPGGLLQAWGTSNQEVQGAFPM